MACRKKPDENPAQSKIQEDEKAVHIQVKRAHNRFRTAVPRAE
jgi:hypothetical protein